MSSEAGSFRSLTKIIGIGDRHVCMVQKGVGRQVECGRRSLVAYAPTQQVAHGPFRGRHISLNIQPTTGRFAGINSILEVYLSLAAEYLKPCCSCFCHPAKVMDASFS